MSSEILALWIAGIVKTAALVLAVVLAILVLLWILGVVQEIAIEIREWWRRRKDRLRW